MNTATTILTDMPATTAKSAVGIAASGQPSFTTPFAALLATGNFVQAPGRALNQGEGAPDLAALLSLGGAGVLPAAEDGPADPAYNVVALFDTTSLSTPATVATVPGLDLAPDIAGAIIDGATIIPMVPLENWAVESGLAAKAIPAAPADDGQASAQTEGLPRTASPGQALRPAQASSPAHDLPETAQPAHKVVTAADLVAEIMQLDPGTPHGTPHETPGVERAETLNPAHTPVATSTLTEPQTTQVHPGPVNSGPVNSGPVHSGPVNSGPVHSGQVHSGQAHSDKAPPPPRNAPATQAAPAVEPTLPAIPAALSAVLGSAVARSASEGLAEGQAAREGQAPDPGQMARMVQSGAVRMPSQLQSTAHRSNAKPATGLKSALSGDAAFAAMSNEPPTSGDTPRSGDAAKPGLAGSGAPGMLVAADQGKLHSSAGIGQALEAIASGLESRNIEVADQQIAPKLAVDARIDAPAPAAQAGRLVEAAVQPERPPALPANPPAPPAEQVALQLRLAVAKGADRISIQLSPASLGAIEITLEVTAGSRVTAQITVERADTLDLLRTDVRGLERALQEAGLRTEQGGLNFNLRGDGNGAHQQNSARTSAQNQASLRDQNEAGPEEPSDAADGEIAADGSLNIEV